MNPNVVNGILRAIVPALVAWLVGKGYIPTGDAANVVAFLLAVGSAGWSVITNWEVPKK